MSKTYFKFVLMSYELIKTNIKAAIQSTLVVSNIQSYDYTWKTLEPVFKQLKTKPDLLDDILKGYEAERLSKKT
jgi:hypothetical protein